MLVERVERHEIYRRTSQYRLHAIRRVGKSNVNVIHSLRRMSTEERSRSTGIGHEVSHVPKGIRSELISIVRFLLVAPCLPLRRSPMQCHSLIL